MRQSYVNLVHRGAIYDVGLTYAQRSGAKVYILGERLYAAGKKYIMMSIGLLKATRGHTTIDVEIG